MPGKVDRGAGSEGIGLVQQYGTHPLPGEIEHHATAAILKLQDVVHGGRGQAGDPGDAVTHGDHAATLADAQAGAVID